MSKETAEWLNTMTLIGFTDKRGEAWHYREELQGERSNHYPNAIPVQEIIERLFYWTPQACPIKIMMVNPDDPEDDLEIIDPTRIAIVKPDTEDVFGVFKADYKIHSYPEWLIENCDLILDGGLLPASAGLLKLGAQAWVQYEMPEMVSTPEGVDFRPFLLAATSLDGSLSSTYLTGSQLVVCDNTLSAALSTASTKIKVPHRKNSLGRINDVRLALNTFATVEENFSAQIHDLCATTVTDQQWSEFLNVHLPLPEVPGKGMTQMENRRESLTSLWNSDPRVSPWKGTAFGVIQAVNTHAHHVASVKNTTGVGGNALRAQRNMERVVKGQHDVLDLGTWENLSKVLASAN